MAKDIDNPCVSLCQLNSELCVSCGRTRDEIRKWRGMKRPEKMATLGAALISLDNNIKSFFNSLIDGRTFGLVLFSASLLLVVISEAYTPSSVEETPERYFLKL